jgi:uncharacterized membrane protein
MILAAYGDGLYKLLFFGHMASFLVAFAPAVIHPILGAQAKADGDPSALARLTGHMAGNGRRIHFPALIALGGFGLAMVFTSSDVIAFDQAWVSLAFLVWLAICGVVSGMLLPAERKVAAGDETALVPLERAGQIVTVLLVVTLYLMVWRPGA